MRVKNQVQSKVVTYFSCQCFKKRKEIKKIKILNLFRNKKIQDVI